ncbi:MAG: hypothetical protein ACKV2O_03005 [Acidimicrobiales bacterium]
MFGMVALLAGCGDSSSVGIETAQNATLDTNVAEPATLSSSRPDGWHSVVAFYASPAVEFATFAQSFEDMVERSDAIVLAEWGGPPETRMTTPRGEEGSSNPAIRAAESIVHLRVLDSRGLQGSKETLSINVFGVDATGSPSPSDQALLFLTWRSDIHQYRIFAGEGVIVNRESTGRVALNELIKLEIAQYEHTGLHAMKKERLEVLGDGVAFNELVRRAGLS